eukprot:GGOE01054417.1.p1 GENE.GGOE01054417.1~~GGOE01054417.1.p1  ORF type:complete len:361 (-),score=111.13 GGOE01054417.1:230-1240(-)
MAAARHVLPHIEQLSALSECRTPLICCIADGDPLSSIEILAKDTKSKVWVATLGEGDAKSEQYTIDYLEVGLALGDWLLVQNFEKASPALMRHLGRELYTTVPDPKNFPRRELFRLWLVIDHRIDLDEDRELPKVLTQHALMAWVDSKLGVCMQTRSRADPGLILEELTSPSKRPKGACELPVEEPDPANGITGPWFFRAADRYCALHEEGGTLRVITDIFDFIEKGEFEKVAAICASNTVDLNGVQKGGLTPLFWAIMCDSLAIVRLLLENGADPNQRRPGNDMPPIFMSIEDPEMLQLLVDFGADLEALWEGKTLADHPETAPTIIAHLKKLQG